MRAAGPSSACPAGRWLEGRSDPDLGDVRWIVVVSASRSSRRPPSVLNVQARMSSHPWGCSSTRRRSSGMTPNTPGPSPEHAPSATRRASHQPASCSRATATGAASSSTERPTWTRPLGALEDTSRSSPFHDDPAERLDASSKSRASHAAHRGSNATGSCSAKDHVLSRRSSPGRAPAARSSWMLRPRRAVVDHEGVDHEGSGGRSSSPRRLGSGRHVGEDTPGKCIGNALQVPISAASDAALSAVQLAISGSSSAPAWETTPSRLRLR